MTRTSDNFVACHLRCRSRCVHTLTLLVLHFSLTTPHATLYISLTLSLRRSLKSPRKRPANPQTSYPPTHCWLDDPIEGLLPTVKKGLALHLFKQQRGLSRTSETPKTNAKFGSICCFGYLMLRYVGTSIVNHSSCSHEEGWFFLCSWACHSTHAAPLVCLLLPFLWSSLTSLSPKYTHQMSLPIQAPQYLRPPSFTRSSHLNCRSTPPPPQTLHPHWGIVLLTKNAIAN